MLENVLERIAVALETLAAQKVAPAPAAQKEAPVAPAPTPAPTPAPAPAPAPVWTPPVAPAAPVAPAPAAALTIDQVRRSLQETMMKLGDKGPSTIQAALSQFGVAQLSALDPAQYHSLLQKVAEGGK